MAGIGDLVVNLAVASGGFNAGLRSAQGQLTGFVGGMKSTLAPLAGILGPIAAAFGGAFAIGKSLDAARTQIDAEEQLAAVLKATGGAAQLSAGQIAEYAAELQGVTNFGDEATIAAASVLATFKEIKGDVFKDVLASAQDMSTVLGTDLKGSVIQLGKAFNDPTRGITALSRAGVSFTEQQKQQIKAMQESGDLLGAQKIVLAELQSEFGGVAQAMADPSDQLANSIGDIAENVGFLLLPALDAAQSLLVQMLGDVSGAAPTFRTIGETVGAVFSRAIPSILAGWNRIRAVATQVITFVGGQISTWLPVIMQTMNVGQAYIGAFYSFVGTAFTGIGTIVSAVWNAITGSTGVTFGGIKDFIFDAMVVAEFAFTNWQKIATLSFLVVWSKALEFINNFSHFFTSTVPALLNWFGSNWKDVFYTAFDLVTTVFTNMGKNIRNVMGQIWEFIKSGGTKSLSLAWTPLTDGFVNTIKEIPEIPKRELSAMETELQKQIGDIGNELDSGMGDLLAKRRSELAGLTLDNLIPNPGEIAAPSMPLPVIEDLEAAELQPVELAKDSRTVSLEPKSVAGMLRGSTEAYSTIVRAMQMNSAMMKQQSIAKPVAVVPSPQVAVAPPNISVAAPGLPPIVPPAAENNASSFDTSMPDISRSLLAMEAAVNVVTVALRRLGTLPFPLPDDQPAPQPRRDMAMPDIVMPQRGESDAEKVVAAVPKQTVAASQRIDREPSPAITDRNADMREQIKLLQKSLNELTAQTIALQQVKRELEDGVIESFS